jgi:hypothetical protein
MRTSNSAAQVKNPRSLFAGRIDGVWTDLGARYIVDYDLKYALST